MLFERFVEEIEANAWNVYGVEVYEQGELTHSYGDTRENIYPIYSATKSVVSVAFGIAYDSGLVDLGKSILGYLPPDKVVALSDTPKDSFSELTLHRLLTMSVDGFPFRPEGESYLDFCLQCEIRNPRERIFNYSNIDAYLIGVALTSALGEDLGEFIKREVLAPMGIERYEFTRSPEGYFYGASGMKLSVHDLSKFGLLMSDGGVYAGRRIVSEEYVRMATSIQQMNKEGGYGFFFWKYRDGFSISGKWKQKCYCLPQKGIVVTFLSHIEEDASGLLESMERILFDI